MRVRVTNLVRPIRRRLISTTTIIIIDAPGQPDPSLCVSPLNNFSIPILSFHLEITIAIGRSVICHTSMEDDDQIHSQPNGRITVTVAAPPPPPTSSSTPAQDTLTLALPIQHPKNPAGREDCWTEPATALLIDAWGQRYLELSRGNLKQKHWKDVADIVSSRHDYVKNPKTDIQCKNRIDTVKKKYKIEKAKIATGSGPSKWPFFNKLDELIGPAAKIHSADANNVSQRVPMGIPVGVRSTSVPQDRFQQKSNPHLSKRPTVESDDESEPEISADSSDGMPPESYKRPRIQTETIMVNNAGAARHGMINKTSIIEDKDSDWGNSMRELTRAILKFGEAYEQAETAKLQQLVDMDKQRMKFAKDLELQRMQFFMKTQLELSQLKHRRDGNKNNHHEVNNNNAINNNTNNNSDSSN